MITLPSSLSLTKTARTGLRFVLSMLADGLKGSGVTVPLLNSGTTLSVSTATNGGDLIITLRCSGLSAAMVQAIHEEVSAGNANAPPAGV